MSSEEETYLGLDFSTQQLKAVVVDSDLKILHEAHVQFDNDLPEFRTHSGVCLVKETKTASAPTLMWVKALDMVLDKLRVVGVDFSKVAALSGTGQQHGSVWWANGAKKTLASLSSEYFLHSQLASSFSVPDSPIWMDSSTTAQCKQLEEVAGGPEKLAEITGSRGYERFTGPQIAKIAQTKPSAYHNTDRISLVSSFACSLFLGDYAPIDWADGSGMNILNIHTKDWQQELLDTLRIIFKALFIRYLLRKWPRDAQTMAQVTHREPVVRQRVTNFNGRFEFRQPHWFAAFADWLEANIPYGHVACGPNLREKLGTLVPSNTDVGPISPYFVERFGFTPECRVIAFTGDNPASLAGMRLHHGDLAISLGTSDTLFLWLKEPKSLVDGHILINPVNKDAYMSLLCFKNGSLTRERIRNSCGCESWTLFNELLESTPRGNFGNLGLYYDAQEIIPFVIGDHRFNKANEKLTRFASKEVEVRALVEGQCIARRAHAEAAGFHIEPSTRILATGGASANTSILQVLADVFNAPVYILEAANSAVLGSAYQAKHGYLATKSKDVDFTELTSSLPEPKLVCKPYKDAAQVYDPMVARYKKIVSELTNKD